MRHRRRSELLKPVMCVYCMATTTTTTRRRHIMVQETDIATASAAGRVVVVVVMFLSPVASPLTRLQNKEATGVHERPSEDVARQWVVPPGAPA